MIRAEELVSMLDAHKRITRAERVHIVCRGGALAVVSNTQTGMTMRTVTRSEGAIDACVDREAVAGLLRRAGDVKAEVRDGRLIFTGKGIRGDVPSIIEDVPKLPRPETAAVLPERDVAFLRDALGKVRLSALERGGLLSIEATGREWRVGCADDVHGAFAFGETRSRIKFGLFPADAEVLYGLISADGPVSLGSFENLLVVTVGATRAAIPTTEAVITDKETVSAGSVPVASMDAGDLRDVLAAVAAIASAKDASPVRFSLNRGIAVSVSSPAGSVSREVTGESRAGIKFGLSHRLLQDMAARMSDNVRVMTVSNPEGVVTQVNFRANGAFYCMLTSE